jgi:RNA polymerase sigma-70 factor (ECF subfamily)
MASNANLGVPATQACGGPEFPNTHWSVVLTAARSDSPQSREALAKLCAAYWYPLYAYIRRRGHSPHEAEDLTQEFFARLLDKRYLAGVTVEGSRFRSYLLTMVKHFLAKEWQKNQAQKRGGNKTILSLDLEAAEGQYQFEPAVSETPETLFERRWASTLLDAVMATLQGEYASKPKLFEALRGCLAGDKGQIPYAQLGEALHMSEGAIKVAVHRLRKRYGELLRAEIAHTVTRSEEIDDEIRHLISVVV